MDEGEQKINPMPGCLLDCEGAVSDTGKSEGKLGIHQPCYLSKRCPLHTQAKQCVHGCGFQRLLRFSDTQMAFKDGPGQDHQ